MTLNDHQMNVLTLFILHSAGCPLPVTTLVDIPALCDINNFTMLENIRHLEEKGQLKVISDGENEFVRITASGNEIAQTLRKDIPLTVREQAINAVAQEVAKLRRDLAVTVKTKENDEGHTMFAEFNDNGTILMRLEMFTPTRLQAELMGQRFKSDPVGVYKKILESLTKEPLQ